MIRPLRFGLALLVGVAQVLGASLPARAQGPVTWQLGRVQFADTSANAQRALRIDEMSADSTGGFVRITALNDGECVPGAGLPPQGILQRFLFRWAFSGDVSRLTFPQQFTVRFTIEADGNVPCLDLNPIMQINVDQGRLDSPLRGARFYWRPEVLPPGTHEPGLRPVRVTTADAWPNPVFFAIAIWGFRGSNRPMYLTATYPYTPATAPPVPADRPTQDMIARAARDRRFGVPVAGSLGSQLDWAPTWELHWLDFNVAGGRRARIYHITNKTNPAARYTIYQDPDTGQWMGWEQAN
jgi:hypothetical protein